MWRKAIDGLLRRSASQTSSSTKPSTSSNGKGIPTQQISPFKQRFTGPKAIDTKSLFQISNPNSSRFLGPAEASMAYMISNMKQASISGASSFKSCWNKSWGQYKYSAPTDARQTHFDAIRTDIMKKYGSLGSTILLVLSAVVTDAVFWWLAELLLDDGM